MQEDDRARALELYGDIFDEIDNDTSVLQLLVSPTRQAVNLARAYDAKDRSGHTAGEPAYLGVIEDLRRQAGSLLPAMPRMDESQISLFSEPEPAQSVNVYESLSLDTLTDVPEETQDEFSEELPDELSDGVSRYPDEDSAESAVLPPPVPVLPQDEEKKEKTPEEELDEFADSVAAFLAGFPVAESEESKDQAPAPAEEAPIKAAPAPVQKEAPVRQQNAKRDISELVMPDVPIVSEKRPIVGLLILFVILAIPVGLLGTGLLLCVGLFALALAAAAIAVGVYGLVTAFTAFSVFADILLVFGLALAAAAVGLLLFWLFVWLVFGVIPDLVRGLVRLSRKLCYKEVTL